MNAQNTAEKTAGRPQPGVVLATTFGFAVVYLAHFFPLSVYLLFERLPYSLGLLAAFFLARWELKKRLPRVFRGVAIAYYAGLGLYLAAALFLVVLIDAGFALAASLALLAVGVVVFRTRYRRAPVFALLTVPVAMMFWGGGDLLLFGAGFGALVLALAVTRATARLPRVALLCFAALALLTGRVGLFYVDNPTAAIPRIVAQEGVEPVFTHAEKNNPLKKAVGCCLQFAAPDCRGDRTLLGSHRGVFVVEADGSFRKVVWGKAFDNAIVDCERDRVFIGDFDERRLIELSATSLTFLRDLSLDVARVTQMAYDAASRTLFLLNEHDMNVLAVDAAALTIGRAYADAGQQDLIVDDGRNRLITTSIARLKVLDLPSGRLTQAIPMGYSLRLAADFAGGRLFVSSFTNGTVRVLDLRDFSDIARLRLRPGVRYLAYEPTRNLLFAGGYLDGILYVIDGATLAVTRRIQLGPRLRHLEISPDARHLYCTSATGAYRIALDAVSK